MFRPSMCRSIAVSDANHGAYDARYTPTGISVSAHIPGATSRRSVPSQGRCTR